MATEAKTSRRAVLKAGIGLAAVGAGSTACAQGAGDSRTLVLLHLAGGNDGLNTIIPYKDPLYRELRPTLSAAARGALPIDGRLALHRSLAPLLPLYRQGRLAIIQGVGAHEPDYSHVGSRHAWLTGSQEPSCERCWWQPVLEARPAMRAVCLGDPQSSPLGGIRRIGRQRASLRQQLAQIVKAVASSRPPSLVFASMGGFDTHADQLPAHAAALRELAEGLAAFQADLYHQGIANRVLLAAWSEFGRRIAENAAGGTDHGSAGPVLVIGSRVRGGLYGKAPSLSETDFGNLVATTQIGDVYSSLSSWISPSAQAPALRLV